ncbi:hypothetical protein HA402_006450 [Bradysia odoriphaga]|nr:hypothetical protein HA402_006450 [Bradysia odoriphaga]
MENIRSRRARPVLDPNEVAEANESRFVQTHVHEIRSLKRTIMRNKSEMDKNKRQMVKNKREMDKKKIEAEKESKKLKQEIEDIKLELARKGRICNGCQKNHDGDTQELLSPSCVRKIVLKTLEDSSSVALVHVRRLFPTPPSSP